MSSHGGSLPPGWSDPGLGAVASASAEGGYVARRPWAVQSQPGGECLGRTWRLHPRRHFCLASHVPPSRELSLRQDQRRCSRCRLSERRLCPINRQKTLRGRIRILLCSTSGQLLCPWRSGEWDGPRATALADCPPRLAQILTGGGPPLTTTLALTWEGDARSLDGSPPSSLPPVGGYCRRPDPRSWSEREGEGLTRRSPPQEVPQTGVVAGGAKDKYLPPRRIPQIELNNVSNSVKYTI